MYSFMRTKSLKVASHPDHIKKILKYVLRFGSLFLRKHIEDELRSFLFPWFSSHMVDDKS